jgi:hypothetical protein
MSAIAHTVKKWLSVWSLLALLAAAEAAANPADSSWAKRLEPATALAVGEVVEAARLDGLPVDPLIARALEGASRGAAGPRIVSAVQRLAGNMRRARALLGTRSTPSELIAASVALSAGVPAETLERLRPSRGERTLVMPLVVLSDLVTRRVPVETASAAVLAAVRADVSDEDLMRLRERIDQDIRAGATPDGATVAGMRRLIGTFNRPPDRPAATQRGSGP